MKGFNDLLDEYGYLEAAQTNKLQEMMGAFGPLFDLHRLLQ